MHIKKRRRHKENHVIIDNIDTKARVNLNITFLKVLSNNPPINLELIINMSLELITNTETSASVSSLLSFGLRIYATLIPIVIFVSQLYATLMFLQLCFSLPYVSTFKFYKYNLLSS